MSTYTYKSTSTAITTAVADLYQAPASAGNAATVLSVLVSNINGTASADLTLSKTDASNNIAGYITYTVPVPANTTLECIPNKIILMAGQKLRVLTSANSYLQATISVVEIV